MTSDAAYTPRLDAALALAADAFRHIRRKGSGAPYLTHLLSVAASVGEHGGDEDQIIAGLLHDYLEDIEGASVEALEAEFGPRVARFVLALSDATSRPKPEWRERKWRYVQALALEPAELKLISAADKLHNASTIVRDHAQVGDAIFNRFSASREQTLWYYRAVIAALSHQFTHPILGELGTMVARMHELSGATLGELRWPCPEPPANDV
jgi:(p)ppGpp synthase/HD superfamily hydrolase